MKLAVSVDVSLSEFWEITPYELNLLVENYYERQKNEYKDKITLAYVNAMWTIQWLGKRSQHPKPLNKILDDLYKEKKVMTNEEMLTRVKMLNSMFGGDVKTCNS